MLRIGLLFQTFSWRIGLFCLLQNELIHGNKGKTWWNDLKTIQDTKRVGELKEDGP